MHMLHDNMLGQNGKINPQTVERDCNEAVSSFCFKLEDHTPSSSIGASMHCISRVINPDRGVHSHHRSKWTRLLKTGSTITGTGNDIIQIIVNVATNWVVSPPASTPEILGVELPVSRLISHNNGPCRMISEVVRIIISTNAAFRSAPSNTTIQSWGAAQYTKAMRSNHIKMT